MVKVIVLFILCILSLTSFAFAEQCYPDTSMLIGAYRRQCNDDGTWKNPQCWASTGHCWCVDPMTGEQIGERQWGLVDCEE